MKAGNDFLVQVKVTAAVPGFGLVLSSVSSTGQTIKAAEPEPNLQCSGACVFQTHVAAANYGLRNIKAQKQKQKCVGV